MIFCGRKITGGKSTELLPCPFCGMRPSVHETFGKLVASCLTAECVQPSTWLVCRTTRLEDIAAVWNRRSKPPAPAWPAPDTPAE